jgi:hypothetical protein
MAGKVLNNGAAGLLVLILPVAMVLVIIFTAWPFILVAIALAIGLKIWDNYQWQQSCKKVNPSFLQLIKENQGSLTPMDLSVKANLTGRSAKRFLERKAEEYGAQRRNYHEQGTVYQFLTVSALGSIFDDSDLATPEEEEQKEEPKTSVPPEPSAQVASSPSPQVPSFSAIAQLANEKQESQPIEQEEIPKTPEAIETKEEVSEAPAEEEVKPKLELIQADLAKRLDLTSSTIARRKTNADFSQWSQSKDPEGLAWKYLPKTQTFVPIED